MTMFRLPRKREKRIYTPVQDLSFLAWLQYIAIMMQKAEMGGWNERAKLW